MQKFCDRSQTFQSFSPVSWPEHYTVRSFVATSCHHYILCHIKRYPHVQSLCLQLIAQLKHPVLSLKGDSIMEQIAITSSVGGSQERSLGKTVLSSPGHSLQHSASSITAANAVSKGRQTCVKASPPSFRFFPEDLKCCQFLQILHKSNQFGAWLQLTPKASAFHWTTTNLKASHLRLSGPPCSPHGEDQQIRTGTDIREISTLSRVGILKLTSLKEWEQEKQSLELLCSSPFSLVFYTTLAPA